MKSILVLFVLATFAACNFNVLVVEVESKEVCVTGLTAEIPADAEGNVTVTLGHDDALGDPESDAFNIDVPEGWEITEVTLLGVGLHAKQGINDLHFIDTLYLEMSATHPELDLPTIELIDVNIDELPYNVSTGSDSKFLAAEGGYNLVDYLQAENLEFGLEMTGEMPANDWEIGLEVCFTFVAEFTEPL